MISDELKVEVMDSEVHPSPLHKVSELERIIEDSKRLDEDTTVEEEAEDSLENVSEDNSEEIVDRLGTSSLEEVMELESSVVD